MNSIKNIISDFGGVILNIDYNRTVNAFSKLGVKNFEEVFSKKQQYHFVDEFEKGNLSPENFRNEIRNFLSHGVNDEKIDAAWNAMLLDLPEKRIELLKKLKKNYRLFLLSNTNGIHEAAFNKILNHVCGVDQFKNIFGRIYFSHHVHLRKPDPEIFNLVLSENKILPEETLFVDDSPQHIESAKRLGIKTLLIEKGKTILDYFGE